jgi:hypothetical protein
VRTTKLTSLALLTAGAFSIALGWFELAGRWNRPDVSPLAFNSNSRSQLTFEVVAVTSQTSVGGLKNQRAVEVLLRNNLAVPIQVLGSTGACTKEGCWAARNLPVTAGPGAEFLIEFQASWAFQPEVPLPVTLYIALPRLTEVHLDLTPNAAMIRQGEF